MSTHPTLPVRLPEAEADTLMWAHPHEIEPAALAQLRTISRLPWTHALRVMPDVHLGKGATVGSVIAMKDAVSPSAVGVDIGCGVVAVETSLTTSDLPDDLSDLRSGIEAAVPVGFRAHDEPVAASSLAAGDRPLIGLVKEHMGGFSRLRAPQIADRFTRAATQCGTLGGGNHFIELCADDTGAIWLTLHSGSRNIGKELAERHISTAKGLEHNLGLEDRDLAVFLAGTEQMDDYLHDLRWAQRYAALNREVMMALVRTVVSAHLPQARFGQTINCHHNYVAREHVDGHDLIVTRKGAIRAGAGDLALIPGSMGTGSFVVRGRGNPTSLHSASHGAGRRLSRTKAKKLYTADDLAEQTAGIECRKDAGVVDEIPGAYKPIESVIEAQADLVDVVARLHTLLCVKG